MANYSSSASLSMISSVPNKPISGHYANVSPVDVFNLKKKKSDRSFVEQNKLHCKPAFVLNAQNAIYIYTYILYTNHRKTRKTSSVRNI